MIVFNHAKFNKNIYDSLNFPSLPLNKTFITPGSILTSIQIPGTIKTYNTASHFNSLTQIHILVFLIFHFNFCFLWTFWKAAPE
jgi:hypothetical protein